MLGIYARVSKIKQDGEDTSIETQIESGRIFAEKLNMNCQEYIDDGISGTSDDIEDRPAFARLMRDIDKKVVTGVYTLYQDRIERNPTIWQMFATYIIKNGCKYYPRGVETDLNDPSAKFAADVMSASNALYAKLTSIRVKDSIKIRAREGRFRGLPAYGYKIGKTGYLEINQDDEAPIIKRIFDLSLEGTGVYQIAEILNNENVPTKYNSFKGVIKRKNTFTGEYDTFEKSDVKWRGNVIHDMVRNPIYKGEKWLNNIMYPVPVIIQSEYWDKVNKNLVLNKRNVGKKHTYNYLLNDIIYCTCCNNKFIGKRGATTKRTTRLRNTYRCKGSIYPDYICKDSRGLNIDKFDSFILKHLFIDKNLKDILLNYPMRDSETNSLETKIEEGKKLLVKKDKELKHAYKLLFDPDFSHDDTVKKKVSDYKKQVQQLQEQITSLENQRKLAHPISRKERTERLMSEYSSEMEFSEIKKLVHNLIESIKIFHRKEEKKSGHFFIEIKYKGYEETSLFMTDWQLNKWYWVSRYRAKANTKEDLEEDTELALSYLEYKGVLNDSIQHPFENANISTVKINQSNSTFQDFEGFETYQGMYKTIVLEPEDIVCFN